MQRKSIGGPLGYDLLAQLHRPTDSAALRAEVQRLATEQKLSAMDISTALRIDLAQVRGMLALKDGEAAEVHRSAWKWPENRISAARVGCGTLESRQAVEPIEQCKHHTCGGDNFGPIGRMSQSAAGIPANPPGGNFSAPSAQRVHEAPCEVSVSAEIVPIPTDCESVCPALSALRTTRQVH